MVPEKKSTIRCRFIALSVILSLTICPLGLYAQSTYQESTVQAKASLTQWLVRGAKAVIRAAVGIGIEEAGTRLMGSAWSPFKTVMKPVIRKLGHFLPDFLRLEELPGERARVVAEKAVERLSKDASLQEMLTRGFLDLSAGQEEILTRLSRIERTLENLEHLARQTQLTAFESLRETQKVLNATEENLEISRDIRRDTREILRLLGKKIPIPRPGLNRYDGEWFSFYYPDAMQGPRPFKQGEIYGYVIGEDYPTEGGFVTGLKFWWKGGYTTMRIEVLAISKRPPSDEEWRASRRKFESMYTEGIPRANVDTLQRILDDTKRSFYIEEKVYSSSDKNEKYYQIFLSRFFYSHPAVVRAMAIVSSEDWEEIKEPIRTSILEGIRFHPPR